MSTASMWWILAGVLVVLELTTGTFYLLLFALGVAAAAVAAQLDASSVVQLLLAALLGGGAMLLWYLKQSKNKLPARTMQSNTDLHIDIGSTVMVDQWMPTGGTSVVHRGATWAAKTVSSAVQTDSALKVGAHRIVAIEGNTLVLEPIA